MRINVLQHTPNEGPGAIQTWSHKHQHEMYIYHPYQFGILPKIDETDMLVILGGPMSPNDHDDWIVQERQLIKEAMTKNIPIFGACFGAQQIAKTLGYKIGKAKKEVGWAPVYLQSDVIPGLPKKLTALHWHEETFEIPDGADLLFSSDLLKNQGFVMNHRIIGLQFHFEPLADNVREMVVNDGSYTAGNYLKQTPADILAHPVPTENEAIMNKLLDYICE
ncbi:MULTISPECIES: type 1 glutamine amidotransferase [Lactobacillus]|uniref:Type 1 glutamine amidotransferase n=1 Tax=Lactobacillus xujianguonis TaxID=2495899 RepID=A0A437STM5_9LACO|nr:MULTISPECIES: type 1 glutamine amidotransferase [Lactobacillus]RVU70207.1 type 1 glutamine amidotransferase [Lactobacillus xujianguonis]RVU76920.1 type 1 glutamine amidotransferase [Lactobacillus xujianguonis]